MNELQELLFFSYEKGKNRECENLSYTVFKDIDFSLDNNPISFYRSDFRGSRFSNIFFNKNNFDIADFISNTFINIEFCCVNFGGAEFKNCYFKSTHFFENQYAGIGVNYCTYVKCDFKKEIFRMSMSHCRFIDCDFIDCNFDQCSTDALSFENCVFIKCELSTMHAENFKISKCTFRDTYLGLCFLGTYMIKDTDFNLISFKYRGNIVSSSSNDYLPDFISGLLKQHRYFEYFNMQIINKAHNPAEILSIILQQIPKEENENVRIYNIKSICEAISFYIGSNLLQAQDFFEIVFVIENANLDSYSAIEKHIFYVELASLKKRAFEFSEPLAYYQTIDPKIICETEVRIDTENSTKAISIIENLFEDINKKFLSSTYKKPYFVVMSQKSGSVVLSIAVGLLLAITAAKVIKGVLHEICEIRLESAKTNRAIALISQSSDYKEFGRTVQITDKAINSNNTMSNISVDKTIDIIGKNQLLDFVIKLVFKV